MDDWGRQAPNVVEGRHGRLVELVGLHWAVISGKAPRENLEDAALCRWQKLGALYVPIPEPSGAMLALLLEHEVVVARPDRVIFGEGKDHPAL
ncbi:MAG: hypothetical protein H8E45_13570 [Proteobacteria bacterium]|nr:hypothetical protein [Pseudomonadota bacterium]